MQPFPNPTARAVLPFQFHGGDYASVSAVEPRSYPKHAWPRAAYQAQQLLGPLPLRIQDACGPGARGLLSG